MLKKNHRLSKQNDFEDIFRHGAFFSGPGLSLRIRKNNLSFSRFAVVAGLKISKKAVQRNRLRRQIWEIFRVNLEKIKKGFDIVVQVKTGLLNQKYGQIEAEIIKIFKKAGIYG